MASERLEVVALEHGGIADGIGNHGALSLAVEPAVAQPGARERAEAASVSTDHARIVEGAGGGIGPAGTVAGFELRVADGARVDDVAAVEVDALPVDEALAGPRAGDAQGVVFEDEPRLARGDAACAGVEAHGNALVGEIGVGRDRIESVAGQLRRGRAACVVSEFEGTDEERAVIHLAPRFALRRGGASGVALRQAGKIGVGDGGVLRRVAAGEEGFADVVENVVLFARHELRLRCHEPPAACERRIHCERIAAVGEWALGETQRVGDRAGEVEIAVAGVADELVDFFPAGE